MKKFVIALLSGAVLFTGTIARADIAQIGDPGKAWSIPDDAQLGQQIQEFLDTQPGEQPSFLVRSDAAYAPTGDQRDFLEDPTCPSATDAKCVGHPMRYQAVLPNCTGSSDVNCIADFGIIDDSGATTSASFSRTFPKKALNQFVGDSSLNLPSGVAGSIYSLPGAAHAGGDKYYLAVTLQGNTQDGSKFSAYNFSIKLFPVDLAPVNYGQGGINSGYSQNNRGRSDGTKYWGMAGPGFGGNNFCVAAAVDESLCAQRYAFPANIRYFVKVRLQQSPGGWLHGRIASPDISIAKDGSNTVLTVAANPVAVPVVYKMYNYVDMPPALKSMYDAKKGAYVNDPWFIQDPANANPGGRSAPNDDPTKRNVIISCEASSATCMEQLKLWLPYVNDQATALLSYWSVRTLSGGEMNNASSCFKDPNQVTGIVTTNSTQYSSGPPTFNKDDGTLNYQVASPHYTTTKDVFKGTYDLVMRSDVARCLYGFSKAPINATISVTSADGTPQLATTVVGEKDGWLYLSAKNFEFSAPTVKAKLTQDAPAPVTPATTTKKPVSITCIKGKTSKVVKGSSCPTGFKRK